MAAVPLRLPVAACLGLGCVLAVSATPLAAQPARPVSPPPEAPALDPVQAASKAAFERLDEAERKAIQNDLIWTGDFNGVAGGEYGKRTHDAMLAFERRKRVTADGILIPAERAVLQRDAAAARGSVRFADIADPATGIRIGLPAAMLTQRVAVENGVVYRRPDGAVTLQLVALPLAGPAATPLADLFERLRRDGPGRKVTYRLQRPDWFVVSGEEGGRAFYTRLAQGPSAIRGYTFRYPLDQAPALGRIMVAIANSFEPFPGTGVAVNPAHAPAQAAAPASPPILPTLRSSEPRHAISAVSIGQGRVLTSTAALRSCAGPSIAGQPFDGGAALIRGDLAVIDVAGLSRPGLALASAMPTDAVFTLSLDDAPQRSVVVSPARWLDGPPRVESALQTGAGGAPVLDRQGRLVGLIREGNRAQRLVAGIAAEAGYAVIPLDALRAAVQPMQPPATSPSGPGLAAAAAALVDIRCARRA